MQQGLKKGWIQATNDTCYPSSILHWAELSDNMLSSWPQQRKDKCEVGTDNRR